MTTSVLLTAHGKLNRLAKRLKCEVTTIASRHYFEPRQAGRQLQRPSRKLQIIDAKFRPRRREEEKRQEMRERREKEGSEQASAASPAYFKKRKNLEGGNNDDDAE